MFHYGQDWQLVNHQGVETQLYDNVQSWFSNQMSSNTARMRNFPGLINASDSARAQLGDPARLITGPNGLAPQAPWGANNSPSSGISWAAAPASILCVQFGDAWGPADQNRLFNLRSARDLQRWETWYYTPRPSYQPVVLADVSQLAASTGLPVLDALQLRPGTSPATGIAMNAVEGVTSALGMRGHTSMRFPGAPDEVAQILTADPEFISTPVLGVPDRHLTAGYSAIEHPITNPTADINRALGRKTRVRLLEEALARENLEGSLEDHFPKKTPTTAGHMRRMLQDF